MRILITSLILSVVIPVIVLTSASSSLAQGITNPDSLSRNPFGWNQKEREFGFSHFDQVFKVRDVPRGNKVHELPQGIAIPAFSKGGQREKELEAFMMDQKVAYVTKYIPDLKGGAYEKVTIRHLLTMTSGVRWNETYADPNSDIVRFYTQPVEPGIDETVSYMRHLRSEAEPGKKWAYKTGETHLLGVLVSAATGQTLSGYLSSKIWIPYGMEQKATWNLGRTNQELAGCCLQMKLRDFGRFGQFILEGARIDGKSIVPDDWLQAATHTQISLWPGWGYGYQWWTLSDGTFRALGIHGQMIHIDPARHLVIVVNSAWPEAESFKRQVAVADFLRAIASEIDKEGKDPQSSVGL